MAGFSSKASSSLLVVVLLTLFTFSSEAKEILVGGKSDAWVVPSSESQSLNKWAESSRFRINDTLVWKYDGAKDSVLQVTKEDYVNCNTSNPIEQHKDGETKIVLDRAGPFYFISGVKDHCEKGQKLHVVVMSHRSSRPLAMSPSPAPSPASSSGPAAVLLEGPAVAPAPTSGASVYGVGLVVALAGLLGPLLI